MARITYDRTEGFPEVIPHPESAAWATFLPHRSPEFKVHTSKGLAHSALSYHGLGSPMAMYELVGSEWVKRFEYTPPDECPACGKKTDRGYWRWELPERSPRIYAGGIPVCGDCINLEKQAHRDAQAEVQRRRQYEQLKQEFGNN